MSSPPSEPNILFLLDQSGSMNSPIGTSGETRLTSLQTAFSAVVADPEIAGLRVGLMGFSNGVGKNAYPHGVSFPVSPIDDEAMPIMMSNLLPGTLSLFLKRRSRPTTPRTVKMSKTRYQVDRNAAPLK